jgi:ATP-dependent Clp protease ATP-binding subunit ClpX
MVSILTEPKDSIVNQYKELFKYDGVELEFTPESLRSIAKETIKRKTGARGLRGILEEILKDSMYSIPSEEGVAKCIVEEGGKVHIVKKQVEDIAC